MNTINKGLKMEKSRKMKNTYIKTKLWREGYGYVCTRVTNSANGSVIKYLKCQDPLCRATAKMVNGEYEDISSNHNHPRNDSETKKIQFKENLKMLIQGSNISVKDAYNRIASTDPSGALHCPMDSLVSSMRRWRNEGTSTAPKPQNLAVLGNCLENGSWKHISRNYDGSFYTGQVSAEHQTALVFGNAKFISSSFKDSHELFVDVSYRLAPTDPYVYQFVTVFAITNAKYIFPVAYVLMEGDSEALYKSVFSYFKTTLASDINPTFIIGPYETNLRAALRSVYTDTNIHGSFFHYVKAIYSKARLLGITNHLHIAEVSTVLKRYYCIPLLPLNLMQEAFDELEGIMPGMFNPLWDYVAVNWFERVTILHMCTYGQPIRTLAFWTSYNLRLNQVFEEDRPEMSKLIGELKKVHTLARAECKKLKDDIPIEKMAFCTDDLFHAELKQKWLDLAEADMSVADFMSAVSNFCDNEHSFFQQFSVDEDISMTDNLPLLKNALFRPHYMQPT